MERILQADTKIAGTNPADGTTITPTKPATWDRMYFYDADPTDGEFNPSKDTIWTDDANKYYDDGIDTHVAGITTENLQGDSNKPWGDMYFYDDSDGVWESGSDAIWVDDGNVYYDDGKDTHLAGATTENALGTLSKPSDWTTMYFHDAVAGNQWDDSKDIIWIDEGNKYYDNGKDTYIAGLDEENQGPGTNSNPFDNVYFLRRWWS